MRRLRVAAAQINTTVGDLDGNVNRILAAAGEATAAGADVVVFPELTITGYPPEDLLLKPGFVRRAREATEKVVAATGSTVLVFGFPEADRGLHNAAAIATGGRLLGVYRKHLLPNYAVFDERRYFQPGASAGPLVEVRGVRVGVSICEDIWTATGPLTAQADGGADLSVNLNGSPYSARRDQKRETMLSTRASDAGIPLVYCNQVGGQDELIFDGGSVAFDATGRLIARARAFAEDLLIVDIEVPEPYRIRQMSGRVPSPDHELRVVAGPPVEEIHEPPTANRIVESLDDLSEIYEALVLGTRDYVHKNGFADVVVGMSGGIDSSLVATIATDALGPEHVHGIAMPSRFSADISSSDAATLAASLGIDFRSIAIEPAHAALLEMMEPSFAGTSEGVAEENIQSRIRGVVWMALCNKFDWLALTCSNKSESAVGYATLYGDTAGGFAVIKDVPKLLVYQLARHRNARAGAELIPESVLTRPPSAELRADQTDAQSLPPYEILDPIIEAYVEGDLTAAEIVDRGFDNETVTRVTRLIDFAEYKRRQSPPGPRITSKAFGKDRRLPITNRFR